MPARGISKYATDRELEQLIQHEDSDDDDYDDKEQRKSQRSKPKARKRGGSTQPRKKQRRTGYNGSDISDDEGEDESEEENWTNESDDEEPEIDPRTGRPRRKVTKQVKKYEESDDEESIAQSTSEEERNLVRPKRRKIVTLKIRTPVPPSSSTRSLRERKPSISLKTQSSGTRRTRRMSEDIGDELVALSSSGRHAIVARAGSRDPEISPRATRGSKSIKYPSRNVIEEDEEPESFPKEEGGALEIPQSQHSEPQDDMGELENQPELPQIVPQLLSDLPAAAAAEMMMMQNEDLLHLSPSVTEPGRPEIELLSDAGDSQLAIQDGQEEEDDDDEPVQAGRGTRAGQKRKADSPPAEEPPPGRRRLRVRSDIGRAASATSRRRRGVDDTSDFDPGEGELGEADDVSDSAGSDASPRKRGSQQADDESSNGGRRSTRLRKKAASRAASGSEDEDLELAEEVAELKKDGKKNKRSSRAEELVFETRGRRNAGRKNYDLLRNLPQIEEDDEPAAPSPSNRTRKTGGGWQRTLFPTHGPFGGAGGRSLFGGPGRPPDIDSDSSDDEIMKQPKPVGGLVGMTPTTAQTPFNPFALQPLNSDPAQGPSGTPANLGKMKDKQALADADPLGVDQHVNFDQVGGLQGHIDQLKEMVALPLLYPEIFMRFKITPPRGVLFHGPPGTGKTLLARALANSVSTEGRKVTFYMRKGADALSKWVGEAERQLRLLFEEARKNQPSIIFFDEIDGLAPVRSSKQEQIHASIVSTLLALMDGMDGRGQVIVIGATNRPDSIDPALRRPGRFDREFYFPLPDVDARRSIIGIHTSGWNPPLDEKVKDELALLTKGYGGADLRALCTEAALNAVQRRYPQIYSSKEKLLIDPKTIHVTPKDFMISIKKMTPSSERSASSGAASLPSGIAPLLDKQFDEIVARVGEILPQKKKSTALEEAMYEDVADGKDFGRERMQQAFESTRVFRPRLLVHGKIGMGQQYLASALLNHFQGIHVQSFDLSTLLSDTTSSPESTVIRLFTEVKMHKPSVIYIPNVQEWYATVGTTVLTTFFGLLRSIKPTDPIMVLGFLEAEPDQEDTALKRDLFGYSQKNQYLLPQPTSQQRKKFFRPIQDYIKTKPSDFPDPTQRRKRQLEILPPAPPPAPKTPPPMTKEELKAQKKRDRVTLNTLKIRLQPIMDQIRMRYKKFRTGVIEESAIRYLYDEADPGTLTSDLVGDQALQIGYRPFELGKDSHGVPCLVDQATNKQYYNIDSVTIEKRLSNGYYKRPKDFLADIKRLAKDAKTIEDEDRQLKANELLANVEVDVAGIELNEPALAAECERVYQRELKREKEAQAKERADAEQQSMPPPRFVAPSSDRAVTTTTEGTGPIRLGENFNIPKDTLGRAAPSTPSRPSSQMSGLSNGYHDARAVYQIQHDSNGTGSGHEADIEMDSQLHANDDSSSKPSDQTQITSSSHGKISSAQPRPFHLMTAPSQQVREAAGISQGRSQTGFVTPLHHNSQVADYANEASTTQTTSAPNNSGPSDHTDRPAYASQDTGPDLFLHHERRSAGGSEVPDTQYTNPSQGMRLRPYPKSAPTSPNKPSSPRRPRRPGNLSSPKEAYLTKWINADLAINPSIPTNGASNAISSNYISADTRPGQFTDYGQTQSVPPPSREYTPSQPLQPASAPVSRASNGSVVAFSNLLNPSPPMDEPSQIRSLLTDSLDAHSQRRGKEKDSEPHGNLVLPRELDIENAIGDLTDQTSGLSVEQMEQVNSVLMDILWQTRGEWDRTRVLHDLIRGFNDVLEDMREIGQEFGDLSWEHGGRRVGLDRRVEG